MLKAEQVVRKKKRIPSLASDFLLRLLMPSGVSGAPMPMRFGVRLVPKLELGNEGTLRKRELQAHSGLAG